MTVTYRIDAPASDTKGLNALFGHLELITSKQDLILSTPDFRNIHISGCGVYPLYASILPLFIGDLLQLWEHSEWRSGDDYFYFTIGSPLSGSNKSHFWNAKDGLGQKSLPSILTLMTPAFTLINTGTALPRGTSFCADIAERQPSKLNIFDLIEYLSDNV